MSAHRRYHGLGFALWLGLSWALVCWGLGPEDFRMARHAGPVAEQPPDFSALELKFRAELATAAPTQRARLAMELAQLYLKHHRVQEAIWTLRAGGAKELAANLAEDLRSHLRTAAPTAPAVRQENAGVAQALHYKLTEDVEGVFKLIRRTPDGQWQAGAPDSRLEIAASRLDELLGLDVVPMTIERELDGHAGSLQYYIRRDPTVAAQDFLQSHMLRMRYERMGVLDYLMANTDRHSQNYLYRPGGILVAIDHGHCSPGSRAQDCQAEAGVWETLARDSELVARLEGLSADKLKQELGSLLFDNEIEQIAARARFLLEHLKPARQDDCPQKLAANG